MSEPKITIIINSYNYERYIGQAIDSAIGQDYKNKEIIVVDDGSTDSSRDIISSYGDKIIPVFHKNLGQARTCLRVIPQATGDYIQFLDSDDYLMPGALTAIAAVLTPDVAKVQFQLTPVNSQSEVVGDPWPTMSTDSRQKLVTLIERQGTYVTPPNSGNVYRSDVFKLIGDIDYESSIDGIPYLLAPLLGEVRQISRPFGCYRYHSENYSGHGTLNSKRFSLEIQRHSARLAHLSTIARESGLAAPNISDPRKHSFVITRHMLKTISDGQRPGLGLYLTYLASLVRERETPRRIVKLMIWGMAAIVTPDKARRWLAIYRSDPSSRRRLVRRSTS